MKYIVLGVIFLGVPFWLLQHFVLPQLQLLENFYSNVDTIADRAVGN